jgi:hypothetical protein
VIATSQLASGPVTYVALSHCWGKRRFLIMNKDNENAFQTIPGVRVSDLPPNFRDAIYATRKLGFRYVWIDSLCILQGSREDWQREAPMMNKVYRNAALTLAPSVSSDAYGGLFRARDPSLVLPYKMQVQVEEPESNAVSQKTFYAVPRSSWKFEVSESPLNQRAWVLQERVLSPRTVYFGKDQIFWECRGMVANSTFVDGLPGRLLGQDFMGPKKFESEIKQRLAASRRGASWYEPWRELLRVYTKCGLTNPSDKLVAISGLAQEFARLLDDEYVAGLWRKNIVDDLLWFTIESSGQPRSRPGAYRAPTWSWASVDAPVLFVDELDLEDYADILQIDVEPVDQDVTMEIKRAVISLRGYLIQIPLPQSDDESGLTLYFDVNNETTIRQCFSLPLRKDIVGRLWGLVLCLVAKVEDGLYKRIGVFSIDTGSQLKDMGQYTQCVENGSVDSNHGWEYFDRGLGQVDFLIV